MYLFLGFWLSETLNTWNNFSAIIRDWNTSETTRGENDEDPRPKETNRSGEASFGEDEDEDEEKQ